MAFSLGISITQNSQSIANNTSNVTVKVTCSWNSGTWDAMNYTKYCTIDGTKYDFSSVDINPNQTTSGSSTLFTKTLDIPHNTDGSKTLSVYASVKTITSSGTQTKSSSKTLTTIPRKSTLILASDDAKCPLGTAVNLRVTRQSTSFIHSIKATCGSSSYYIKADGTTSSSEVKHSDCDLNFTLPMIWASQNTKGTSLSVTFLLTTYSGTTAVGTHSLTQTCTIPNNTSTTPSVSLTVTDTSGCYSKYGKYVQGQSSLAFKLTCSAKYSASIASRSLTFDGVSYSATSNDATIEISSIKGAGSLTAKVTVKDSRGFTNTASVTCSVLAYSPPSVTELVIYRSNENTTENPSGEYLSVQYSVKVSPLDNKNTANYYLWYKKPAADDYTIEPLDGISGAYVILGLTTVFEADTTSSYDVKIVAEDDFFNGDSAITKSGTGSSVKKVWAIAPKGLGFAFGKVAEYIESLGERFEVAWNARFYENVDIDGNINIGGNSDIGGNANVSGSITLNNSSFLRSKDNTGADRLMVGMNSLNEYVFGYGSRDSELGASFFDGNTVYIRSNNDIYMCKGSTVYRPYYSAGDTITYNGLHTAGFVTSDKTTVLFVVPLDKPVIGNPTITASSGNGFMIRQNNAYKFGTSSSAYKSPSSYSCMLRGSTLVMYVTFPADSSVTNNETVGVSWYGHITFS